MKREKEFVLRALEAKTADFLHEVNGTRMTLELLFLQLNIKITIIFLFPCLTLLKDLVISKRKIR